MSLSTREQRTLDSIEHRLAGSDPGLASQLALFTRLTAGERMPARETISADGRTRHIRRPERDRHLRPGRAGRRSRTAGRHLVSQQAGLLLWLVIAIGLVTLALAVSRTSGRRACPVTWAAVCTRQSPARPNRELPQQSGTALPGGPVPRRVAAHALIHPGLGVEVSVRLRMAGPVARTSGSWPISAVLAGSNLPVFCARTCPESHP